MKFKPSSKVAATVAEGQVAANDWKIFDFTATVCNRFAASLTSLQMAVPFLRAQVGMKPQVVQVC